LVPTMLAAMGGSYKNTAAVMPRGGGIKSGKRVGHGVKAGAGVGHAFPRGGPAKRG